MNTSCCRLQRNGLNTNWTPRYPSKNSTCDRLLRPRRPATGAELEQFERLSRAQYGEDKHIMKYLTPVLGRVDGVVLESGALDGLRYSSTYALQHALHWKAVHIEASGEFEQLEKNRPEGPQCVNMRAALCGREQTVHFMENKEPAVRGIWEFMLQQFRVDFYPEYDSLQPTPVLLPGRKQVSAFTTLPCRPLGAVLPPQIDTIDVWFLDVEGAEAAVLRSTDFSKLQIGIVVKERQNDNWIAEQEASAHLQNNGFDFVGTDSIGTSSIFVNRCIAENAELLSL